MKNDNTILREAEQQPRDTVARQIGPHLPQSITHRAAQWHAYWPTELHTHQIKANRVPLSFLKGSEPVPNDLAPAARAIENDGYFSWAARRDALDMGHVPYNVRPFNKVASMNERH